MTDFTAFDPKTRKNQKPITIKMGDYTMTFPKPFKMKGATGKQVIEALRRYSNQP